jgi:hypothetical protein
MRTINATVSIRRAARFVPPIENLQPQLEILTEARNGVAHLAHARQADELRVPFLKASEYLRVSLELDRYEYWGEFVTLVDAALEESAQEAKIRAANAVAAGRVEFQNRYGHLDRDARLGVIHAIEAGYDVDAYEEQLVGCPACESPAYVSGACETRWEPGDEHTHESFIGTFFPGFLRCRVCDLELDGEDQLRAAGIDESWDIEVDPADFYEPEWEDDR